VLDDATAVPGPRGGHDTRLSSFSSPRIERGTIVFDGEANESRSAVFAAAPDDSAGRFVIRPVLWAADGGFVSVYGGSGGSDGVAFVGVRLESSGVYVRHGSEAPRLLVGSGQALPGMTGRVIGPAVGRGLRAVDTGTDASSGTVFVSLSNESFGVFLAPAAAAPWLSGPASRVRPIAVNGSTLLPGCPQGHATVGAVGTAPTLARDGSAASFYAGNGEPQTAPTACEGIYTWCEACRPASLDVVADTRQHSTAPPADGVVSGPATFTAFGQSSIAASATHMGADVAFYADSRTVAGAVRRGVYLQRAAAGPRPPALPLRCVADTTMPGPLPAGIPGAAAPSRPFTSFDAVSVHSEAVVFRAQVHGKQGVYLQDSSGSLHVIADAHTVAPPPAKPGSTFQYVELSERAFDGHGVVFYGVVGTDDDAEAYRRNATRNADSAAQGTRGLWYVNVSHIVTPGGLPSLPFSDPFRRADGALGNGWTEGWAATGNFSQLGLHDGAVTMIGPTIRNGTYPPPCNATSGSIPPGDLLVAGCAWRETGATSITVSVRWSGLWQFPHHIESSPLLHVTPGTLSFGMGIWPAILYGKPVFLVGAIGDPGRLFDVMDAAVFNHTDGHPRDISVQSDGAALRFFLDGAAVKLNKAGYDPLPIPPELRGSTLHGFAVDTHCVSPYQRATGLPAITEFKATPASGQGDSSSSQLKTDDDDRDTEYDLLVSRCDAASLADKSWAFSNGPEWAGSTGSLTAALPRSTTLTLRYNFSGQPTATRGYVAAEFYHGTSSLSMVPSPTALSVQLAGASAAVMIRVVDAQQQTHLGGAIHNASDTGPLVVPLTKAALPTHYSGPNDGVIHFPVTKISIGVDNRGNQAGTLLLSNLSLRTVTAPAAALTATVTPASSFGVAFTDEVRSAGGHHLVVNVMNILRSSCEFGLQFVDLKTGTARPFVAQCDNADRLVGSPTGENGTVAIGGWSGVSCSTIITADAVTGYFPFVMRVQAVGKCSSPRQPTIEGALVVLDRMLQPQADVARVFGSQFLGANMASAAARLGIAHTRIQVYWRWMQRTQGTAPDMTSGNMQSMIESAVKHNITVTLDMRAEPPDWAINSNGSAAERYAPWSLYPRPEHLPAYTAFVADVLARFCSKTDGIEVGNEPDSVVYYGTPLTSLEQGVALYVGTMQAVQNATAAACPALMEQITALSVSGEEFWTAHNFEFVQGVLSALRHKSGIKLAGVSPHPYARQHYLPTVPAAWGNASWTMPEDVLPSQFSLEDSLRNLSRVVQQSTGSAALPIRPTEFGYVRSTVSYCLCCIGDLRLTCMCVCANASSRACLRTKAPAPSGLVSTALLSHSTASCCGL
jgi:hypothetical protein